MSVVDAKTVHSVFRFIASMLAIGASVISVLIVGSMFNRERAGALVVEIRRVIKRE
jgi:hypothetical protein